MELKHSFSLLHFMNNQEWLPLPGWARFFLGLGETLASANVEKSRYTIALALPTRSYAAALVGTGFSCANLLYHSYEDAEYLKFIYSLPEGTSIKYFDNGKLIKAKKKDVREYNGRLHIGVQTEGTTVKYILPQNANKIEVADQDYEHLPNRQMGRNVIVPSELLLALVPDKANEFIYRTKIDGVVVGVKNTLSGESNLPVAIISRGKKRMRGGQLSDLFRVDAFHPRSIGHRYLMHSSNSNRSEIVEVDDFAPETLVIFDGALGFLKWREMYRGQNWVVVLDHTDPNFPNAIAEINREHLSRSELNFNLEFPLIPSGIEVMSFARDL